MFDYMKFRRIVCAVGVCMLLLFVTGCNNQAEKAQEQKAEAVQEKKEQPKKEDKKEEKVSEKELKIKVYFPDDEAIGVFGEERNVKYAKDKLYESVIAAILDGPKEKGHVSIMPRGTKLRKVTLKDGVATVDFSSDLTKKFVGGTTGEELLIASIVNTLTEFKEIKEVKFLVEGKPIESLAGHMDLTLPVKRMDYVIREGK